MWINIPNKADKVCDIGLLFTVCISTDIHLLTHLSEKLHKIHFSLFCLHVFLPDLNQETRNIETNNDYNITHNKITNNPVIHMKLFAYKALQ